MMNAIVARFRPVWFVSFVGLAAVAIASDLAVRRVAARRAAQVEAAALSTASDHLMERCEERFRAIAPLFGPDAEVVRWSPAGDGVALRTRLFTAGLSSSVQPGVVDRDWYDLNHGFAPVDLALVGEGAQDTSLFKDVGGRSAFFASRATDAPGAGEVRVRAFAAVSSAVAACVAE